MVFDKHSIRDLKAHLSNLEKTMKKFEAIEHGNNPYELEIVLNEIEKITEKIKEEKIIEPISEWISEERKRIGELKSDFEGKFAEALTEAMKEKGFEPDGRFPDLKTWLLTLSFDFDRQRMTIWYGPKQERLGIEKLDAKKIAKKVEEIHRSLAEKPLNENDFMNRLYTAYMRLLRINNLNEGEYVPIIQVLNELSFIIQDKSFMIDPSKVNFTEYTRVQFSYDLYRCKNVYEGKILELETATMKKSMNRADYLWIPKNDYGEGQVCSSLRFRRYNNI